MNILSDIPWQHWLVIISILLSLIGTSGYLFDTIKGKTKPNRVSWLLWGIGPLVGIGASISAEADGWVIARVSLAGFLPILIFLVSFINKKSYWKSDRIDYICGACAFIAIFFWLGTKNLELAILLSILADSLAIIPTLKKSWHNPETESRYLYLLVTIGVFIMIPAVPVWDIENSGMLIYLIVANTLLTLNLYKKEIGKYLYIFLP